MVTQEIQEYLKKVKIKVKKEDYRFGVITRDGTSRGAIAICNCGNHSPASVYGTTSCEKCKNEYFVNVTSKRHHRFTIPYLGLHYKNEKGFKIKRTNLSIVLVGDKVVPIQENLVRTVEFNMVEKFLKVWREDKFELEVRGDTPDQSHLVESVSRNLLAGMDISPFWKFIETDVTREIFEIAESHANSLHWGQTRKGSVLRGLIMLLRQEGEWFQILANAGVTNIKRFYTSRRYSSNYNVIDKSKTKPHEILRVPKFMMNYIREDHSINLNTLADLQTHFKKVNINQFKEIMSIVKDEGTVKELSSSLENIMTIHVDYGYTNIRKLILYLFRETKLTQGIENARESTTLLKDYIRMSRALGVEWEKYPKSLKKVHDVVMLNYRLINQNEKMQRMFSMSVEKTSYQDLAFENKKEPYIMILPSSPQDLVDEGNELSHCISSYCNAVVEDKCKIIFMRDKENPAEPLVSVEVRGFNIRQAKGRSNRSTTTEEKEFIKKWAEEKGLVEAYY